MLAARLLLLLLLLAAAVPAPPTAALSRDQVVETSVGRLRGRFSPVNDGRLPSVMQYLGVPYAAPPVGSLRFMPPRTPSRRPEVRVVDRLPPACPQRRPPPAERALPGRRRRPEPAPTQSEDCLYLNIYAPVTEDSQRQAASLPVMVYLHGESSAGQVDPPYDGTVLARFGGVIVVTVNYRVGVLGFLKPAVAEARQSMTNFALHDQRAALSWVHKNIVKFGGDHTNVTVMGQGTGAVCASLLTISPLTRQPDVLFKRAILMSGSSLSPWAMTFDPVKVTISVAKALNCSMKDDRTLLDCLRSKSFTELVNVDFQWPKYSPSLAPSEDGIVVPRWDRKPASLANQLSHFDLLFGVTSQENLHLLSSHQLSAGITREARDRLLRSFLRSGYRRHTKALLSMATNRYLDAPMNVIKYRDKTLEMLSDADVVAPLVRLANIHADSTSSSYMYVFSHVTSDGGNRQFGSMSGDELPYVFGAPLAPKGDSAPVYYTQAETVLSEYMMTAWTNFAKTGDPNRASHDPNRASHQGGFISEPSSNSQFYNLNWRQYDRHNQRYLDLASIPRESAHYRSDKLEFWNGVVLERLPSPAVYDEPSPEDYDDRPDSLPQSGRPVFPPPPLAPSTPPPRPHPHALPPREEPPPPAPADGKQHNGGGTAEVATTAASGMLSIVIVVGVCFVLLNLLILGGVYYQKQRLKVRERRLERRSSLSEGGSRSASVRSSRESVARPRLLARSASGDDLASPPESAAVTPAVSRESVARVTISEGNGVFCPRRTSDGSVATRRGAEGGARDATEADGSGRRRDRDRPGRAGAVVKERSLDQRTPRGKEQGAGGRRSSTQTALSESSATRSSTLGRERGASRTDRGAPRTAGEPVSCSDSVRSKTIHVSGTLPRTSSTGSNSTPHPQRSASLKQANKPGKPANKSPQAKKKGITLSEKSFAQDLLQRVMPKSQTKQPTKPASPPRDRPPRGILKTRTPASPASDSSGIYSEMVPALRGSVSGLSTGSGCRVVYRTDSTCQVDLPDDPDDAHRSAAEHEAEERGEPDSASVSSARSLQLSRSSSVGGRSSSSIHFVPRAVVLPPPPPEPQPEQPEFPTVRFEPGPDEDRDDVLMALRRTTQRAEVPGYRRSIAGLPPVNGAEPAEAARCMSLQRGGAGGCRRGRQKPPPPPRTSSRTEGLYAARDVTCPHGYPVHPPPPGPDPLERFVPGQAESPDPSGDGPTDGPVFGGQREGPVVAGAGGPRGEETVTFQLQQPPPRWGTQF